MAESAVDAPAAKPAFTPCHGTSGRFARCPGTPQPRRRHRRKHSDTANCACPEGSEMVPSAKGRGFACSARTKEGARFVPMRCSNEPGAPAVVNKPSASSRAKRAAKVDWSRCRCPSGSELRTSAKGRKQCVQKNAKGGVSSVKAVCTEGLKGLSRRR